MQRSNCPVFNDAAYYLHELKKDLQIGRKTVLGGGQQTYAIVKNFMKKSLLHLARSFLVTGM